MKCISVYTRDFTAFSDIYETIVNTSWDEDEERVIEGITVSESGIMPPYYFEKMKDKKEVVVMKEKEKDITILQHGGIFEILIPEQQSMLH